MTLFEKSTKLILISLLSQLTFSDCAYVFRGLCTANIYTTFVNYNIVAFFHPQRRYIFFYDFLPLPFS